MTTVFMAEITGFGARASTRPVSKDGDTVAGRVIDDTDYWVTISVPGGKDSPKIPVSREFWEMASRQVEDRKYTAIFAELRDIPLLAPSYNPVLGDPKSDVWGKSRPLVCQCGNTYSGAFNFIIHHKRQHGEINLPIKNGVIEPCGNCEHFGHTAATCPENNDLGKAAAKYGRKT